MKLTLEDILKRVGGYVDQDASLPTGTDLTNRINYANRALDEWASTYDWNGLTYKYKVSAPAVSTTSLALPVNTKKPMSALYEYSNAIPQEYVLIDREDHYGKDAGDYYAYMDGNPSQGFSLVVPKGLPSGASLAIDLQRHPSSLATTTDTPEIPNSEYLVQRVISLVLEARSDPRFPIAKAEADRLLANLVEDQNSRNRGMVNRIRRYNTFVIGRD